VGGGRRSGVVGVRATADGRQSRIAPVYTRPGALHTAGAPPPRLRRRGDSCGVPLGPRRGARTVLLLTDPADPATAPAAGAWHGRAGVRSRKAALSWGDAGK
jgi:hypothetical protein